MTTAPLEESTEAIRKAVNEQQRQKAQFESLNGSGEPEDTQVGGEHYLGYVIQPHVFAIKNDIPAYEWQVIKHTLRHKHKDGINDLRKAKHELELLAKEHYGEKL